MDTEEEDAVAKPLGKTSGADNAGERERRWECGSNPAKGRGKKTERETPRRTTAMARRGFRHTSRPSFGSGRKPPRESRRRGRRWRKMEPGKQRPGAAYHTREEYDTEDEIED